MSEFLVHVYECDECPLVFSVEQTLEDQSFIKCPECGSSDGLRDLGEGKVEMNA
ncbi:hypothetical protein [Desertibacillus haloalkaliphilus]|uniref:hypothetical protein n=1 Tax=Desertibacillus haloalkaliphilus TaxID=1328930 RepID=UPI001C2711CF|nr:hypothetical protein [Desertibacillus haloalkaliphilus]MBU8908546.1 hypothetical protein [Desertibacillus haloalkaliphilus]